MGVNAKVEVKYGAIEPALRTLGKQLVKDNALFEIRRAEFFEKPSVKKRKKAVNARRRRESAAVRAQRQHEKTYGRR